MSIKVLLMERLNIVVEDAKGQFNVPDSEDFTTTELAQVKAIFHDHSIQHVFMGAGIEIEQRLEIVRSVFQDSEKNTTVRRKDAASGQKGCFPVAQAILSGRYKPGYHVWSARDCLLHAF